MKFSAEYYQSGNYRGYLTRRFAPLARDIKDAACIRGDCKVLDFGCGYGGLVDALHSIGVEDVVGTDISTWAIDHGKMVFPHIATRLKYYNRNLLVEPHNTLIMLDVLEHIPEYEAECVLRLARAGLSGHVVLRIPVCSVEGQPFVLNVSNNDPTHINCHTRDWWHSLLSECGFEFSIALNKESIYSSDGVLSEIWI